MGASSDPTAVKPANKAEQPSAERSARKAAELVERRAGAKGNADQQSTRRTQSRESVSQALERIRKVARERKKERFTTEAIVVDKPEPSAPPPYAARRNGLLTTGANWGGVGRSNETRQSRMALPPRSLVAIASSEIARPAF